MKAWFKYCGFKFNLTAPPTAGLTVVILILVCFLGCEKQYPWKLQSENTQTLVVDGILTNEPKAQ